jgi:hypothetical protein
MPWNNDNTGPTWGTERELFPGVFEKTRHDPETGRFENIIYSKQDPTRHYHGWSDPARNDAGGQINHND